MGTRVAELQFAADAAEQAAKKTKDAATKEKVRVLKIATDSAQNLIGRKKSDFSHAIRLEERKAALAFWASEAAKKAQVVKDETDAKTGSSGRLHSSMCMSDAMPCHYAEKL